MHAIIDLHTERATTLARKRATLRSRWALQPIAYRLRFIRELRHLIAENAETLAVAAAAVSDRPVAEKLVIRSPPARRCVPLAGEERGPRARTASLRKKRTSVLDAAAFRLKCSASRSASCS